MCVFTSSGLKRGVQTVPPFLDEKKEEVESAYWNKLGKIPPFQAMLKNTSRCTWQSAPHKPPSGHLCPLSPVPTLERVSGTSRFVFRLTSYNFIQYKEEYYRLNFTPKEECFWNVSCCSRVLVAQLGAAAALPLWPCFSRLRGGAGSLKSSVIASDHG